MLRRIFSERLKDGEHVEQIVFCQIAEEPQGRMDLYGLAKFRQVFRDTRPGQGQRHD